MTHKFKGHSHAFTTTQCHAFLPFGFYTANCFEMISGTLQKRRTLSGCCNVTNAVKSALPAVRRRLGATNYAVWSAKESAGACEVGFSFSVDPPPMYPLLPPSPPLSCSLGPTCEEAPPSSLGGGRAGSRGSSHHAASCELRVVKQLAWETNQLRQCVLDSF